MKIPDIRKIHCTKTTIAILKQAKNATFTKFFTKNLFWRTLYRNSKAIFSNPSNLVDITQITSAPEPVSTHNIIIKNLKKELYLLRLIFITPFGAKPQDEKIKSVTSVLTTFNRNLKMKLRQTRGNFAIFWVPECVYASIMAFLLYSLFYSSYSSNEGGNKNSKKEIIK